MGFFSVLRREAGDSYAILFEKLCLLLDIAKRSKNWYNRASFGALVHCGVAHLTPVIHRCERMSTQFLVCDSYVIPSGHQ